MFFSFFTFLFILVCVGVLSASCWLAVGLLSDCQIIYKNIQLNSVNNADYRRNFVVELRLVSGLSETVLLKPRGVSPWIEMQTLNAPKLAKWAVC